LYETFDLVTLPTYAINTRLIQNMLMILLGVNEINTDKSY